MLFIELLKVGLQSVVPVGRGRVGGPGSNAAPTAARARRPESPESGSRDGEPVWATLNSQKSPASQDPNSVSQ